MKLSTIQNRITSFSISKFLLLFIFIFGFVITYAQTGLNFQGVARNSNNVILASQQISLRLSVLQGTATGVAEYTETRTVTTNAQGLFTAVIGDAGASSTLGNFTTINWKNTPKFLKIEMDAAAGTNFTTMGTTQFQYVAYAQFANGVDAANIAGIVPVEKGGTGVASITTLKTALAIDKINNTTDAEKPISTKTQAALDLILVTATDTSRFSNRINAKANASDVATGLATKVDKVTGKELSTNDYTTVEKIKLAAITGTNTGDQDLTSYATNTSLSLKANTTDLTTGLALKANALDVATDLATKASTLDLTTGLATKVDKVTGKVLSTNDYTAAEKTKLAAITGSNTGDQDLTSYATNTALALKANTSDINTSLGLKASVTDVTTSLALKEDATNKSAAADLGGVFPSDILYPTQKAVKDYVTANNASGGISDGSVTTIKLDNLAVTDAKIYTVSGSKVIGNIAGNAATVTVNANLTGVVKSVGNETSIASGTISNSMLANTAVADLSGSNTGDNSVNSNYSSLVSNATHTGDATGSTTLTVVKINGTSLAGLGTGILKNTTLTGIPSIAVAGDFPTLNQSTTGNAATVTTNANLSGVVTSVGNITSIATGTISNSMLANSAVANLSGTNTGDNAVNSNYSSLISNATHTGDATGSSSLTVVKINGTSLAGLGTGILKNTTGTGVPSIAVASDFPTLNQSTTGNSATATKLATSRSINGVAFNGTADITIAAVANAETLAGNNINTTITGSSLTSVGILNNATINGKVIVGASSAASASAVLEASSTTQGFLPPRMTLEQRIAITSPAQGLMIYCTNCGANGEPEYFNGTTWLTFAGTAATAIPTVNIVVGTYTYTSSSTQGPSAATNTGTGTSYTFSYSGTGFTTYGPSATKPKDGGTYTVIATVAANGNYTAASSNPTAFKIALNLSLGNGYGGGTVAYILKSDDVGYDALQQHGLIISGDLTASFTNIIWGTEGVLIRASGGFDNAAPSGVTTFVELGAGINNTNLIIAAEREGTTYAAGLAKAYNGGGYTNWYLPSFSELYGISLNRLNLGTNTHTYHWTSTEEDLNNAKLVTLGSGNLYALAKGFANGAVRAVRVF